MNNYLNNLGNLLQIWSFMILQQDFFNIDIMQELQKQDKEYFEKILKNQEEILEFLKKE
jgi:hypothetical protein